jgi:hypothetical protein
MHNIEQYGGKRVDPGSPVIKVQFDTGENMDRWLRMMRAWYPSRDQFEPHVNRAALIVVY